MDAGRRPRFLDAPDQLRVDRELLRERQRPPERRQRDAFSLKHSGDRIEALKLLLWGSGASEGRQGVAPRERGGIDERRDRRHILGDAQL